MTIDKAVEPSPPIFGSGDCGVSEQEALRTLKDCFADYQDTVLLKALNAGKIGAKYDVGICINWLLDQQQTNFKQHISSQSVLSVKPETSVAESSRTSTLLSPPTQSKPRTDNKEVTDNDLQKAIQNSLREQGPAGLGGQISAEEQELSRVIEASIAASKTRDLRQSSLFFTDPANPHERERSAVWPVGLKNVGNTCWFSVVVQALFNLPAFRHWIYDINLNNVATPPTDSQAASSSSIFPTKELEFIYELRRLFALLLASKRKYVDPSYVVEVLRKQESLQLRNGGVDNQQDVSEFTHLLLEWIEEAFNFVRKNNQKESLQKDQNANSVDESVDLEMEPSTGAATSNPIQKLFYGSVLIESHCLESISVKEDRFSQYPLQVIGYDNLHDSFEASMCQEELDEVTKATTSIEHWLTETPPVFLFELSRFRYNQGDNKPEKIHSRFVFPQTLYIDRYLEKNRQIVRQKRDTVRHLRQHLKLLKAQLEKYEKFGSGSAKISLPDVLRYTLEFARGHKSIGSERKVDSMMDVNMESPRLSLNDEGIQYKQPDQGEPVLMDVEQSTTARGDSTASNAEFSMNAEEPRPKLATDEERNVLENCLTRWCREVEEQIEDLKSKINEIENSIVDVYKEDCMKQRAYVLHAVLVHEGQATLGHYWAFVADHKTQTWKKFNDVQVTEVDWDQLERDCYGGYQNTSAYCLIYVADSVDFVNGTSFLSSVDDLLGSLPGDLKQYVERDNNVFSNEIASWDDRHHLTAAGASHDLSKAAMADQQAASHKSENRAHLSPEVVENFDLSKNYAQDVIKVCGLLIGEVQNLSSVIQSEICKVQTLWNEFLISKDLLKDPRLPNIAAYGVAWMSPTVDERVVARILFDMLSHNLNSNSSLSENIKTFAAKNLQDVSSAYALDENQMKLYCAINRDFNLFSRSVLLVSFAIEHYHNKKNYTQALQHLILAEDYTKNLIGPDKSHPNRGVYYNLLMNYKRSTITHLSAELYDSFRAANGEDEINKFCATIQTLVVPVLNNLAQENEDGFKTSEEIKSTWLTLLNEADRRKFGSETDKRLQDLYDAIQAVGSMKPINPNMTAKFKISNDVHQRYLKAVQTAIGAKMLSN